MRHNNPVVIDHGEAGAHFRKGEITAKYILLFLPTQQREVCICIIFKNSSSTSKEKKLGQ